jgi:hypothetical protein
VIESAHGPAERDAAELRGKFAAELTRFVLAWFFGNEDSAARAKIVSGKIAPQTIRLRFCGL